MSELKTSNPYTLTKEQYQELYKEILLFAQIGGVANDENILWKMCEEEFVKELMPAIEAEDPLKVIDGVCDSKVTLVQLHHYYLSKPSWEQPLFNDTGWEYAPFYRLEEMILKRKENYVQSCMSCWLEVAEVCAKEYNFNLYKAIKEVNRSNMTKFPSFNEVSKYLEDNNLSLNQLLEQMSQGKNKDVTITDSWQVDSWQVRNLLVFRADGGKGKIVKWPLFQEPNFDHCWL